MLRNGLWFVALVVSACTPWTVLQQAEPNPLAGSKMIAVLPLDWSGVAIDDLSEPAWNETNDAEMKQEWLVDRQLAITEFQKGVFEASGRLQLVPGGAPLTLRSSVTSLKTGGIRPLYITFRAELLGADGRTLEEISTTVKESRGRHEWGLFQNRLANASRAGGANVAEYLMKRAGLD